MALFWQGSRSPMTQWEPPMLQAYTAQLRRVLLCPAGSKGFWPPKDKCRQPERSPNAWVSSSPSGLEAPWWPHVLLHPGLSWDSPTASCGLYHCDHSDAFLCPEYFTHLTCPGVSSNCYFLQNSVAPMSYLIKLNWLDRKSVV